MTPMETNNYLRSSQSRNGRDRILEVTRGGELDPQEVVEMLSRWMTSEEIYDMCSAHEINLARLLGE